MATVFLWSDGTLVFSQSNRELVLVEQLYATFQTFLFIRLLGTALKLVAAPQFTCRHTAFADSGLQVFAEPDSQYV